MEKMTREEADKLQETLDSYVQLKEKGARAKGALIVLRMSLAQYIEPFIAEVKIGGDVDLMGVVSSFARALGVKIGHKTMAVSVVDGHESADPDDIGWEEYEKLYCVRVPGEIAEEALNLRSSKMMFELASERGIRATGGTVSHPAKCDECADETHDPIKVAERTLCDTCFTHSCEVCGALDSQTINGYATCLEHTETR